MSRQLTPIVYILASQTRGTIYVGATGYPLERMQQHREAAIPGFTAKNGVKRLVYIEYFASMPEAIAREKQLKRWHRPGKINLIEQANPMWRDLARDLGFGPPAPKLPSNLDAETSSA